MLGDDSHAQQRQLQRAGRILNGIVAQAAWWWQRVSASKALGMWWCRALGPDSAAAGSVAALQKKIEALQASLSQHTAAAPQQLTTAAPASGRASAGVTLNPNRASNPNPSLNPNAEP